MNWRSSKESDGMSHKRGVLFEIPNGYGRFLLDMLKPVEPADFNWLLADGECYLVENGELSDENLFPQDPQVMTGEAFKKRLEDARYYLIFADLKAFPKDGHPEDVSTYESYMKSSCELIVLTADSSFVTIYCKDQKKLELLYQNAKDCGFKRIEYITDHNDARTGMHV